MALNFADLIFGILIFLKGTLFNAFSIFILAFIGNWLYNLISGKFKAKWLASSFAATYIISFLIVAALFIYPLVSIDKDTVATLLPFMQNTPAEDASYALGVFLRFLVVSLIISLIIMPFNLFGAFVSSYISGKFRKLPSFVRLYLACFIVTLIAEIIAIIWFPWMLPGLINLVYFGFR